MNYEAALAALEQLVSQAQAITDEANEATVRFQLIDTLITDVLGWQKAVVKVERYERGDYTDYECGSPTTLLIEAKRASTHFTVPVGPIGPVCKIKTLCDSSGDVTAALTQAIDYCRNRSIAHGAICNGKQLVLFLGSRTDSISALDGKALIYLSLEDMLARFGELWDAASPHGMREENLSRLLKGSSLSPPPMKLSSRIAGYPGHKNRNPIATELQILGGLFIDDIAESPELEEEFLNKTYCQSGALSQYAVVSKELLRTRYTTFFEQQTGVSASPATTKKGTSHELTADIVAAGLSRRPILLVGDVGVGKTTFVRNLIKVDAKDELKNAIVLYIDFGAKPTVAEDLRSYAVDEIIRQLRDDFGVDIRERQFVRGVYNQRIQEFGRSVYSDLKEVDPDGFKKEEIKFIASLVENKEEHLKLSLEHASKGQKRQIVIFLDNVDQRPPNFQEEVFLMAHAFATNWPVTAFVALRPETFSLSRARGALAAYQPRVFTIEPPRVDLVLNKRLKFALHMLKSTGSLPGMPHGFTIQSKRLENYLEMLIDAFENRNDIIELIDNMCSGNVRRALEYVGFFVGSGHVDSGKILTAIERTGRYMLPIHEFFRAVIHRDREHYDPSDSPISNVYDISTSDAREHFAALLTLAYVERAGQVGGSNGFVARGQIYTHLQTFGFQEQQITSAVRRVLEKELVLTPVGLKGDDEDRLRITTAGAYMLRKVCGLFSYLDAVVIDTPIIDLDVRSDINDQRQIEGRLARAERFLDYLDRSWGKLDPIANREYDWPAMSTSARLQIGEIKRRVSNNGG